MLFAYKLIFFCFHSLCSLFDSPTVSQYIRLISNDITTPLIEERRVATDMVFFLATAAVAAATPEATAVATDVASISISLIKCIP